MRGIQLRIPIDENVKPVVQHARRPPVSLLLKIEDKLDMLLKTDIIEEVQGYSQWVSPLVIIVKDNGDLRLCVDMRQANKAILRENHLMPTFDDFLPRMKSAKYFSRLDIKDAFHQIELEEGCRPITTFISHKGVYRYKRLMFGISCAPEMFQKVMEQMLCNCQNSMNYIDDIIVFGNTEKEHDEELGKVIKVLKEHYVLLNQGKCVYKVPEITFLGHRISHNGVLPADDKIDAVKSFRAPQNVDELRSFLGLVTYVGRFIPDLAETAEPLRILMRSNVNFTWTSAQENAFQKLKSMVGHLNVLKLFNTSYRTRVIADASPVALGAVLVQFESEIDANPRVISFASKSLTNTERRYCQTEKEALALVWSVESFKTYLLGRRFELETDHKPLEVIFSTNSRPCARIERWVLRLQSFQYDVRYRKGSQNIADSMSRLSQPGTAEDFDKENKFMVLAIMESVAIDISEIEERTRGDSELDCIVKSLHSGNWLDPKSKPYEPFKTELGLVGDLLVRGTKLVIPSNLRNRMLALAHEGHPGESLMKRRLRDRVWWLGMDKEVAKWVSHCEGCRLVSLPGKPEPMIRRKLPLGPWIDVAIDFMGPLPTGEYLLVIVDYFSRYKEIEIMNKITAKDTINRLQRIFVRLGYPRTITLDNGRQFISSEFDDFCKTRGIILNLTIPYWPQQNGEVERQNRSLLKRLQISHALGRDWKKDIEDYLLMYNTTPHSVTGKTPTELCYGRTIRGKIPSIADIETAPPSEEFRDKDAIQKQKGKEKEDERRGAKKSTVSVGDTVLLQNLFKPNKLATNFGANEYKVVDTRGSRMTVTDEESGRTVDRNVAHLKKINSPMKSLPVSEQTNSFPDSSYESQSQLTSPNVSTSPRTTYSETQMNPVHLHVKENARDDLMIMRGIWIETIRLV